jgi:hypothetical protein
VKAFNDLGYSDASDVLLVWLSVLPSQPTNLVVTLDEDTVNVAWSPSVSEFTPITRYWIMVRMADGVTFNNEVTGCDGSQASVITNTYCEISKENLNQAPHNLPWGDYVYIKVIAESDAG